MKRKEMAKFVQKVIVVKRMFTVVSWTTMLKWYRALEDKEDMKDIRHAISLVLCGNKRSDLEIDNNKPYMMFNLPKTSDVLSKINVEDKYLMPVHLKDYSIYLDINTEKIIPTKGIDPVEYKSITDELNNLQNKIHFNINVFLDTGMMELYDICDRLDINNDTDSKSIWLYKEIIQWDDKYCIQDEEL